MDTTLKKEEKNASVNKTSKKTSMNTKSLTLMAVLSAMAIVLMLLQIPVWFAPSFYKFDLSEVPILIGSFILGPIAGILLEVIKILLNLITDGTTTAFIGEFANLAMGCAFVVPSAIIYRKYKTTKAVVVGLSVGTITLVIVGSALNAYLLLPVYAGVYGMPIESLIEMGTKVNPNITDLSTFILFAVAPFNILKGVVVSFVTAILYTYIKPLIKRFI